MDKVTRQCPQTTTFLQRREPKRYWTEVLPLTSLTSYFLAKPAHLIFTRFCCCFKMSKKLKNCWTHAITKCTLTSLVQQAKKSHQKWDLKSHMCISHNIASSFQCHTCQLELKMLLPPAKKKQTPACIREIHVHKLWTKVYSQKGLTAMLYAKLKGSWCSICDAKDTQWGNELVKQVLVMVSKKKEEVTI